MARLTEIDWNHIKTYFITQTANVVNKTESIRSVAKRFGISPAALSRKASAKDENNKSWYDYRNEFINKSLAKTGADDIKLVVDDINKNRKVLSLLGSVVVNKLSKILKDKDKVAELEDKLSIKDIVSIIKLSTDIDLRMVEIHKEGLIKKPTKIVINMNKPLSEMSEDELKGFRDSLSNNFSDVDYEVVEDE